MGKRVLIVDDEPSMGAVLKAALERHGYTVRALSRGDQVLPALREESFDVVITDLRMKGPDGLEVCERVITNFPHVPVILMTAFGSLDTAVAAMRAGAFDFLTKPFKPDVLELSIERALKHRSLQEEVSLLRSRLRATEGFGEIVGESQALRELTDVASRVAATETSVLILGETGTGKELLARALHAASPRTDRPFLAVNCAAMPEALLESELFGHAKGAFTDAKASRDGLFRHADGGTLFLDEIGDMPLPLQAKLLRVLQERTIRPLGTNQEIPVDVRIVAATHQDLEQAVRERSFREDLLYRINVIQLDVPPLRDRGGDVLLLAQHFLERFCAREKKSVKGFTPPAAERFLEYDWPGNVRELSNAIERAVTLTSHDQILVEDLPAKLRNYQYESGEGVSPLVSDEREFITLGQLERRYIFRVLKAVGGNKARAARILGLDRRTLYRRLEQYGKA